MIGWTSYSPGSTRVNKFGRASHTPIVAVDRGEAKMLLECFLIGWNKYLPLVAGDYRFRSTGHAPIVAVHGR